MKGEHNDETNNLLPGRKSCYWNPESIAKVFRHGRLSKDVVIEYVTAQGLMDTLGMRDPGCVGEKEQKTDDVAFRAGI